MSPACSLLVRFTAWCLCRLSFPSLLSSLAFPSRDWFLLATFLAGFTPSESCFSAGRGARQTPARPSNMTPVAPANRSNSGGRSQPGGSPSPFQRDGGRAAGYCTGRSPPSLHQAGLANQYLFVELEKDGVWKVRWVLCSNRSVEGWCWG